MPSTPPAARTIIASTFSTNQASVGAAISKYEATTDVSIVNSTFVSNTNIDNERGLVNIQFGLLSMQNSTLVAPDAIDSCAVYLSGSAGQPAVKNSIVAGNDAGPACDLSSIPLDPSSTHNLANDTSCGTTAFTVSNRVLLGALGDYGGATQTAPLLPGSDAIQGGDAATCEPIDQRGITRPQPVGAVCDIGAFESWGFQMALRSGNNQSTAVNTAFANPLGVTLSGVFPEPVDGGVVTFVPPNSGASASLAPSVTVAIAGGIAEVNATANSQTGSYSVPANAAGAALPVAFSLTNGNGDTTTTLVAAPDSITYGQAITLTATITHQGIGVPAGKVTFNDGGTPLGEPVTVDGIGHATFVVLNPAAGQHNFTAEFTGDPGFAKSESGNLPYTISPATTTTTVTSSSQPTVFGQQTVFEATVTSSAPGTPGGRVDFFDGATNLGNGALSAAGKATLTYGSLSVGAHTAITAQYSGDTNYAGSTSLAYTHTVNKAVTFAAITSQANPSAFGETVNFTATVTVLAPGVGTPSGTVSFREGATELGIGNLVNGIATFTKADLSVGSHSITAQYSGDDSFQSSVSGSTVQVVDRYGSLTSLTTVPNPTLVGQNVQIITSVSANQISAIAGMNTVATGDVVFVDENGTALGAKTLVDGVATLDKSNWPEGVFHVRAFYSGDANYAPSSSALVDHTVNRRATTTTLTTAPNPAAEGTNVTLTGWWPKACRRPTPMRSASLPAR